MTIKKITDEMRLFSSTGSRLYLTAQERERFLDAASKQNRGVRMFCHVLHYTGARPTEIAEIVPARINTQEHSITIRSIKKRILNKQGQPLPHQYRSIPVPHKLIDDLDLVFDLHTLQNDHARSQERLWKYSRTTYWRAIKSVMKVAGITGPQASAKGLRHGFGIAMLSGPTPLPIPVLRDLMGHADSKTTEIYLQISGREKRKLVMQAWADDSDNPNR